MCRVIHVFIFIVLAFVAQNNPFAATELDTKMWTTNGEVRAIAPDVANNRVFVGGRFSRVGPYHGALAVLAEAGPLRLGFPAVNGFIHSVISDGSGGFFIAGDFSRVGNVDVSNVAHITKIGSNYEVDQSFSFNFDGKINKMLAHGGVLYIGGLFTQINDQSRPYLAALNTNGTLNAWNPQLDGAVSDMTKDSSNLYIVGNFKNVNVATDPVARNYLAAFALNPTINAATNWNPNISFDDSFPIFHAIIKKGNQIIIGGRFKITVAAVLQHRNLMAISDDSVVNDAWKPNPNGRVYTLEASAANGFYVGGEFTNLQNNGSTEFKSHLAHFATNNIIGGAGLVTTIANGNSTSIEPNNIVYAIEERASNIVTLAPNSMVEDGILYLGGSFDRVNSFTWQRMAAVKITNGALDNLLSWNVPFVERPVKSLSLQDLGSTVAEPVIFTSGDFLLLDGEVRHNIAAFDLTTGQALDWNPDIQAGSASFGFSPERATVFSLKLIDSTTLVAGGNFDRIEGVDINNLAKLHVVSRAIDSNLMDELWLPNPSGTVFSVEYNPFNSQLYVGGKFQQIGGLNVTHLGRLNLTSSTALSGITNIGAGGRANKLALSADGTRLYIGGRFSIASPIRENLAAIDTATESIINWIFDADAAVQTISPNPDYVFSAGSFTDIGNTTKGLAKLSTSLSVNLPENWGIDEVCGQRAIPCPFNATIYGSSLDSGNNSLFFGGLFQRLDTQLRNYAGIITSFDNSLSDWQMSNLRAAAPGVLSMENQDRLNGSGILLEKILFAGTQNSGLEVYRFIPTTTSLSNSDVSQVPVSVDINCEPSPVSPCTSIWYNIDSVDAVKPGTSTAFTDSVLLSTNGSYTFRHMACNAEGICEQERISNITVNDTIAPAGSMSINSAAAETNDPQVSITLSSADPGIASYYLDNNNIRPNDAVFVDFTTSPITHTLSAGDGQKFVYVWLQDSAGNVSAANMPSASDDIMLDSTAPTITSFNTTPAEFTNSRNINIDLVDYDGTASSYYITDINLIDAAPATPSTDDFILAAPANSFSYILNSVGDGSKVIYIWFIDNLGNISAAYTSNIDLDTVDPIIDITSPTATYLNTKSIQLSGTLSEPTATISILDSSNNPIGALINRLGNNWTADFTLLNDGAYTFTAQATDNAGNSASASISFTVDTTLNAQLLINGMSNPDPTNSNNVSLDLSASDISGITAYYISNDNIDPITSAYTNIVAQQNFSLTINSHSLTAGEGSKTVYVWLLDQAGNNLKLSNAITVDTSVNGSFTINASSTPVITNDVNVDLVIAATDSTGVVGYYISESASAPLIGDYTLVSPKEINFSRTINNYALSAGDGTKTLYVWIRDELGNVFQDSNTVTKDTSLTASIRLNNSLNPAPSNNLTTSVEVSTTDLTGIAAYYITSSAAAPLPADYTTVSPVENNFIRSTTIDLNPGDGMKTVYVWLKDNAGNEQQFSNSILIDATITAQLLLNALSNPGPINTASVSLQLNANDASGIVAYYISNTATPPLDGQYTNLAAEQSFNHTVSSYALTANDGLKTVYAWIKDAAGNVAQTSNQILLDTSLTGELRINGDLVPVATNNTTASLQLSANDASGIVAYYISNSPTAPLDAQYTTLATEQNFTRSITAYDLGSTDGLINIYAWMKDAAGNVSQINNQIVLDTSISGQLRINGDLLTQPSNTTTVNLQLSATDQTGIIAYYISDNATTPLDNQYTNIAADSNFSYSDANYTLSSGDGLKTIYAWLKDAAGNVQQLNNQILLDQSLAGQLSINGSLSPAPTNSPLVNIQLSATDASGIIAYYLSNTAIPPLDADYTSIPVDNNFSFNNSSYDLGTGDGLKNVYAWLKDGAGNVTQISNQIVLDSSLSAELRINGNVSTTPTNSPMVSVQLSANDNSGITAYYISMASTPPSEDQYTSIIATQNFVHNIAAYDVGAGDGLKTIYAWLKDDAGNASQINNQILLDQTAPSMNTLAFTDSRVVVLDSSNFTNSTSVLISFSAADTHSSIAQYYYGEDNSAHNSSNNTAVPVSGANLNINDLSISFTNNSNGLKNLYFWLEDDLGNVSNAQILSVNYDNELSASLSINGSATPGTTNSQTATLGLSSTDLSGVVAYYISNIGTPPSDNAYSTVSPREPNFARTINNYDLGVGDGNKTIYAWLKDAAGNIVSIQNSIVLDSTAPELSITSHTNGQKINNTLLALAGTANGATEVHVALNGSNLNPISPTSGAWSINLTGMLEGDNSIAVFATDGINSTPILAISIVVDTTAPSQATVNSPSGNTTSREDNIVFAGTAEANAIVSLYRDAALIGSTTVSATGNWQILSGTTAEGTYTFTLIVTDEAGNDSINSNGITVNFDLTNNAPEVTSPTIALLAQEGIALAGNMQAQDPEGDGFTFLVTSDVSKGVLNWNGDGSFQYTPDLGAAGSDSFSFQARDDYLGGEATSSIATINFDINARPTAPELLSPNNGASGVNPNQAIFTWNKSTDADGDAISYELHVCETTDFDCNSFSVAWWQLEESVVIAGFGGGSFILLALYGAGMIRRRYWLLIALTFALTACGGGGNGANNTPPPVNTDKVTKSIAGLTTNTLYYWKVIAIDARGGRNESVVRSFTTAP